MNNGDDVLHSYTTSMPCATILKKVYMYTCVDKIFKLEKNLYMYTSNSGIHVYDDNRHAALYLVLSTSI